MEASTLEFLNIFFAAIKFCTKIHLAKVKIRFVNRQYSPKTYKMEAIQNLKTFLSGKIFL